MENLQTFTSLLYFYHTPITLGKVKADFSEENVLYVW